MNTNVGSKSVFVFIRVHSRLNASFSGGRKLESPDVVSYRSAVQCAKRFGELSHRSLLHIFTTAKVQNDLLLRERHHCVATVSNHEPIFVRCGFQAADDFSPT